MKNFFKYIFLFIFIVIFLTFPCSAKVRFAYIDVPPYAYQDASKKPKGLLIEKIKTIMNAMDMDVEFVHLPHRRLIDFIEQGNVDLWAGQYDSQVNNELSLMSKMPVFIMELQAYWKLGNKSVDKFEDLKNKNLVLISSYSYGGYFSQLSEESHSVSYVINHEDGFDKLLSGDNQYLLGYKKISHGVIDKFQITNVKESSLSKYPLYLKLSKTFPNAPELMKKIDALLLAQIPKNIN